jgi:hypothetical protein
MTNQQGTDQVRSLRAAIGILAMAEGAGLLKNGGSALGVFLLQRILPHPGNGTLPICVLRQGGSVAQGDQKSGNSQQLERARFCFPGLGAAEGAAPASR